MATKTKTASSPATRMPPEPKTDGSFTCYFAKERDTKGTYVYRQVDSAGNSFPVDQGAQIGSLYIRKSAFENGAPANLSVIVSSRD